MQPVVATSTTTVAGDDPIGGRHVEPVKGQPFSKVLDGAQAGRYVNTSHNARRGELFALIERNGREWHVYGTGAARKVFEIPTPAKVAATLKAALKDHPDTPATGGLSAA